MKRTYILTLALLVVAVGVVFFGITESPNGAFLAALSVVDVAPTGFIFEEPDEVSLDTAGLALAQAEKDIKEMQELNLASLYSGDALREARQAFEAEDYRKVIELSQLIRYVKDEKIEFLDRLKLLEVRKQAYLERGGTSVEKVNSLSGQAINSFNLDRLDEANAELVQANNELRDANKEFQRVKIVDFFSKNFLVRNWWKILLVLVILSVVSPIVIKKSRKSLLRRQIEGLTSELDKMEELIKRMQKECFIEKIITTETYKVRAAKYEDRITEIKHSLPILQAQFRKISSKSSDRKNKNQSKKKSKSKSQKESKKKIVGKKKKTGKRLQPKKSNRAVTKKRKIRRKSSSK